MKKQLGQFFTTNSDYIFQGFEKFVKDKEVSDNKKSIHIAGAKQNHGF